MDTSHYIGCERYGNQLGPKRLLRERGQLTVLSFWALQVENNSYNSNVPLKSRRLEICDR